MRHAAAIDWLPLSERGQFHSRFTVSHQTYARLCHYDGCAAILSCVVALV